jgi:hypothetical protein
MTGSDERRVRAGIPASSRTFSRAQASDVRLWQAIGGTRKQLPLNLSCSGRWHFLYFLSYVCESAGTFLGG